MAGFQVSTEAGARPALPRAAINSYCRLLTHRGSRVTTGSLSIAHPPCRGTSRLPAVSISLRRRLGRGQRNDTTNTFHFRYRSICDYGAEGGKCSSKTEVRLANRTLKSVEVQSPQSI